MAAFSAATMIVVANQLINVIGASPSSVALAIGAGAIATLVDRI
jgi:hypothetical protein